MFGKLDEVTGTGIFSEIYEQNVASDNFPDLAQTYRALGIATGPGGIEFSAEEKEARLRDAIMGATAPIASEEE